MRITEIIKNIYCYAATIRAKQANSTLTVKTVIWANGILEAKALLSSMYGADSVVSVTRVTQDQLSEAVPNGTGPQARLQAAPQLLPTAMKHNQAQRWLLAQMKRNAAQVKPTKHDLALAQDDFDIEQKRINLAYEKNLKWVAIRKKRGQSIKTV
jgi:hypothetical protein